MTMTPEKLFRYKYDKSKKWILCENSMEDKVPQLEYFVHSEGAKPAEFWMNGPVSFTKLKITNDSRNLSHVLYL